MTEKKNKPCVDIYNRLISVIELDKIELIKLECFKNREFVRGKAIDLAIAFQSNDVEQEGTELKVPVDFTVIAHNDTEIDVEENSNKEINDIEEDAIFFKIEFELLVIYELDIRQDKELFLNSDISDAIGRFTDRNIPVNIWPYVREIVSSVTTRMGITTLVLPMYKKTPMF